MIARLIGGIVWCVRVTTESVIDQFDCLYEEGAGSLRVMGIGVHPFLLGQPFRARAFERALEHIAGHSDVWLTTPDAIAEWYLQAS